MIYVGRTILHELSFYSNTLWLHLSSAILLSYYDVIQKSSQDSPTKRCFCIRFAQKRENSGKAGDSKRYTCPHLLVGVGVATSVETAALLSKKALMRPIGSHNENENAAKMEKLLEDGINAIGLGPQGMGGKFSVMGVNIENTARHPSTIGVAVNVGCWSHRRGHIVVDKDLGVTCDTHSTWKFNG